MSLLQHPSFDGEGVDRNIALVGESHSSKSVDHLPHFYIDVTPVTESVKNLPIPATTITSLKGKDTINKLSSSTLGLITQRKCCMMIKVCLQLMYPGLLIMQANFPTSVK